MGGSGEVGGQRRWVPLSPLRRGGVSGCRVSGWGRRSSRAVGTSSFGNSGGRRWPCRDMVGGPVVVIRLQRSGNGWWLGWGEGSRVQCWRGLGGGQGSWVAPRRGGCRRWGVTGGRGCCASGWVTPGAGAAPGGRRSAGRRGSQSACCCGSRSARGASTVCGNCALGSGRVRPPSVAWLPPTAARAERSRFASASSADFSRPGHRHRRRLGCRSGLVSASTSSSSLSST